ncbi:hypothetical protein I7I50_02643 [Histoplasma capsulatum G186AR]|uniref:Uncharacterized protein n=1 Tax=Ajellomyces capsulatus TaxID=5037 RepID=A0A8H8D6K9_AJECA|nr:hypothetical protein I7I52_00691 [Histoplasma capsulatum]QSS71701.1 hypothetical protein I7I50_02643 [Histoplasma capsulatum G186AR]
MPTGLHRSPQNQRRLSHPTEHPTTQSYRMKFQGPLLVSFQSTGGGEGFLSYPSCSPDTLS